MARARNIKPGFYKNEDLAECSVWARLIFPGLWMLADREGRLEDRPKRIKGELLPFDELGIEPLLNELQDRKFILRYETEDGRFIQILKFSTHQAPHYSEKPSVIKPPQFSESKPPSTPVDSGNDKPKQTQREAAQYLYFAQRGAADGPIKIGISERPELRMRTLQGGGAEELRILVVVSQTPEINERVLHERFAGDRLEGEWFRATAAGLMELIASLQPPPTPGDTASLRGGRNPLTPDSLLLTPDSGLLTPDSLNPEEDASPAQIGLAMPPPTFLGDANESLIVKRARVLIDTAWELPERWGTDAEALGFTPAEILREAEKFRQYYVAGKGQGTRRSIKGWRQCWSNWLGNAERFRRTP